MAAGYPVAGSWLGWCFWEHRSETNIGDLFRLFWLPAAPAIGGPFGFVFFLRGCNSVVLRRSFGRWWIGLLLNVKANGTIHRWRWGGQWRALSPKPVCETPPAGLGSHFHSKGSRWLPTNLCVQLMGTRQGTFMVVYSQGCGAGDS